MDRKQAGARARAKWLWLRSKPALRQDNTSLRIQVSYWNCNGILILCKQEEIVEAMNSEELDLVFIDKIHLWKGGNADMLVMHHGHQSSKSEILTWRAVLENWFLGRMSGGRQTVMSHHYFPFRATY